MSEQADEGPAERGQRFTDRGARFTRRRFMGRAGVAALAVGTGALVAGCQFDDGPYQGKNVQGGGTGQSSTSGQNATTGPSPSKTGGHSSSGSQSGASS